MFPCSRFHSEALPTEHFKTHTDARHFNYRNLSDKLGQKDLPQIFLQVQHKD